MIQRDEQKYREKRGNALTHYHRTDQTHHKNIKYTYSKPWREEAVWVVREKHHYPHYVPERRTCHILTSRKVHCFHIISQSCFLIRYFTPFENINFCSGFPLNMLLMWMWMWVTIESVLFSLLFIILFQLSKSHSCLCMSGKN